VVVSAVVVSGSDSFNLAIFSAETGIGSVTSSSALRFSAVFSAESPLFSAVFSSSVVVVVVASSLPFVESPF